MLQHDPASARGGFGRTVTQTDKQVSTIERLGTVLTFDYGCYFRWRQLLTQYSITGVSVHDARLVAIMDYYGIVTIVTLNTSDFQRYGYIDAKHPRDV